MLPWGHKIPPSCVWQETENKSKAIVLRTTGNTRNTVSAAVVFTPVKQSQACILTKPLQDTHIFLYIHLTLEYCHFLDLRAFLRLTDPLHLQPTPFVWWRPNLQTLRHAPPKLILSHAAFWLRTSPYSTPGGYYSALHPWYHLMPFHLARM